MPMWTEIAIFIFLLRFNKKKAKYNWNVLLFEFILKWNSTWNAVIRPPFLPARCCVCNYKNMKININKKIASFTIYIAEIKIILMALYGELWKRRYLWATKSIAPSVESKQITASIETNILREMQFNGSIDFQDE